MEVFSNLHEKRKENNKKNFNVIKKEDEIELETEKKIDALIAEYEKDKKTNEKIPILKKEIEAKDSIKKLAEISSNDKKNILKNTDINYDEIIQVENLIEEKIEGSDEEYKQKEGHKGKFFNKKSKKIDIKKHDSGLKIPKIRFRRKKIKDNVNHNADIKQDKSKSNKENISETDGYIEKRKNKSDRELTFDDKKLEEKMDNEKISLNQQNDNIFKTNKQNNNENLLVDNDIRKVLEITDNLLGKLPEEIIDEFVKSEDFKLYEKVINKFL